MFSYIYLFIFNFKDNGQDVRNNNGNKNGSVEMYSSNSNMAASVENVNSISEKSDHYGGKSFNVGNR